MKKHKRNGRGISYKARVAEVNRIYDEHRRSGLSNVEIWRRYVYPKLYPFQTDLWHKQVLTP